MVWFHCGFEQNLLRSAIFTGSQPDQREGPKMGFLCLEVGGGRGLWHRVDEVRLWL